MVYGARAVKTIKGGSSSSSNNNNNDKNTDSNDGNNNNGNSSSNSSSAGSGLPTGGAARAGAAVRNRGNQEKNRVDRAGADGLTMPDKTGAYEDTGERPSSPTLSQDLIPRAVRNDFANHTLPDLSLADLDLLGQIFSELTDPDALTGVQAIRQMGGFHSTGLNRILELQHADDWLGALFGNFTGP